MGYRNTFSELRIGVSEMISLFFVQEFLRHLPIRDFYWGIIPVTYFYFSSDFSSTLSPVINFPVRPVNKFLEKINIFIWYIMEKVLYLCIL